MDFEKPSKYTVYRLTVAEALERFKRGISKDPRIANRPIAFYFPDQFTFVPLACPPSSDARLGPSVPSERPTEEAGRGVCAFGVLEKIADPKARQEAFRRRALDIGNGICNTWMDLGTLIACEYPDVRRLAASAIKKRLDRDPSIARMLFRPLVKALIRENYPQAQQYMLSALKRCGKEIDDASADYLKDVARDPTLPMSLRETASQIVHDFESHKKLKESVHRHWCHRCKKPITKEESAAGIEKYGKPYCKRCLDERLLGDVNFENMVDVAKSRRTLDGVAVQSLGEKRIADWLAAHHIPYEYDERFRIVEDTTIRPDFYLREFDLYIEYWGMNTPQYNANRQKKLELYQREGRKLISLGFEDDSHLEERLLERLSLHIPALAQRRT